MNRDYLIKLTFAVFRTTECWEESNFLKFQIRSLCNEILIDFILISCQDSNTRTKNRFLSNIQDLEEALFQARNQKLMDRKKFLLFQKEYRKIGEILEVNEPEEPEIRVQKPKKEVEPKKEDAVKQNKQLNQRQTKILEILKNKTGVQVWELKQVFPNISKRTLRRDLDDLLQNKLVKRHGEWNEVFYELF